MRLDKLSSNAKPYQAEGLHTLYGGDGYWEAALPMPAVASLWDSPLALPHRGLGAAAFADPGETPVLLENDDGGDTPDPVLIRTSRWLVFNDVAIEKAIIATLLADLPNLRDIQSQVVLDDDTQILPSSWDEGTLRSMVSLVHVTVPAVKGIQPYFGVELSCTWEREHGYGIMFHGLEVVETGGGDVPNLAWIAARHAEGGS